MITSIHKNTLDEWLEKFKEIPVPDLVAIPTEDFRVGENGKETLYITQEGLNALYKVKEHFRTNEGIEILSAYRDAEIQFNLWRDRLEDIIQKHPNLSLEECEKKAGLYTASPYHPGFPPHMRGDAVDVRLIIDNHPAVMETDVKDYDQNRFDYFSKINPSIHHNRERLRELMMAGNFIPYDREYWHFGLTHAFPKKNCLNKK